MNENDRAHFALSAESVAEAEFQATQSDDWTLVWEAFDKAQTHIQHIQDPLVQKVLWERYEAHYMVLEDRAIKEGH